MPRLSTLRGLQVFKCVTGSVFEDVARKYVTEASSAPVAFQAAQRLQEAITPAVVGALQTTGYAVVDGVFGTNLSVQLCKEIKALQQHMHLNCTHLVQGSRTSYLEKRSVHEADLLEPETVAATPVFAELQSDTGLRTMLSILMPHLRLSSQAIKLQYNAGGGGCFPIHFDSDERVDARWVTCILYLNRNWSKGDGGELRLYNFAERPVDIEPIDGRMLLFSSCRMLHRVLPSEAERYCFTIWLSQSRGGAAPPNSLASILQRTRSQGEVDCNQLLQEPEVRKCVAKVAHEEEWVESLYESHPDSPERSAVVASFRQEVAFYRKELAHLIPWLDAPEKRNDLLRIVRQQPYAWL